jgi:cytochrome P450
LENELYALHENDSQNSCFLGLLANAQSNNVKDESFLQDIREMLAGGSDTSANTLTYALYYLSLNTNALERATKEVDEHFNSDDISSHKHLHFLNNVLKETMRLIPAGPLIFRKTLYDDELDGYKIPSGVTLTLLIFNLYFVYLRFGRAT